MQRTSQADQLFAQGMALHQQGQLAQAQAIYEKVLEIQPKHFNTLHLSGVIATQTKKHSLAVDLIAQAIEINPKIAATYSNRGNALKELKQFDAAVASYDKAIAIKPDYAEAYSNRGNALTELKQFDAAVASYDKAVAIKPGLAEAYSNRGNALKELKQFDAAMASYDKAIAIKPDYAEAYSNRGNALKELKQFDAAAASYDKAVAIKPDYADAYYNRGISLKELKQFDAAVASYDKAIALKPDHADAYYNRGISLKELKQFDAAVTSYDKAIALKPDYAEAYSNRGNALKDLRQLDAAVASYRRALEIKFDYAEAHSNLLLALNYTLRPADQVWREHLAFGERHGGPLREGVRAWPNGCNSVRALRVGYVSPDFRTHSVAFFIEPILAAHDSAGFEVFCYADVAQGDALTERLQRYPVSWRDIHLLSDQQVCERIREDGIDILVDLAGHTAKNRMLVFARKPAPVQVTYLGYPNTTGLEEIDYRISDAWADPAGLTAPYYTEQIIRLPHGFLCYRPDAGSPAVADLPALSQDHITFGSFNNLTKVTDTMIALWSRVLHAVPDSRFILKAKALADKTVRERIAHLFAEQGVDQSRLQLLAQIPSIEGHLAAYHAIDIALDTFPYHGTTTSFEALWMGAPVVTLAGQVHVARVGVSILSRMGLPELIAKTPEDYISIAASLAGDLQRLRVLRQTMRQRMAEHGLMHAATLTRDLEAAYADMWHCYCAKQSVGGVLLSSLGIKGTSTKEACKANGVRSYNIAFPS